MSKFAHTRLASRREQERQRRHGYQFGYSLARRAKAVAVNARYRSRDQPVGALQKAAGGPQGCAPDRNQTLPARLTGLPKARPLVAIRTRLNWRRNSPTGPTSGASMGSDPRNHEPVKVCRMILAKSVPDRRRCHHPGHAGGSPWLYDLTMELLPNPPGGLCHAQYPES
jgi:hypothetical protein